MPLLIVEYFLPSGGVNSLMRSEFDAAGLVVVVPGTGPTPGTMVTPESTKIQKSLVLERLNNGKDVSKEKPCWSRLSSSAKIRCKESAPNVLAPNPSGRNTSD